MGSTLTLVCVADTHGFHDGLQVPDGDIFLHAGDLTQRGTRPQLEAVNAWLTRLPHRHKVVIAGNHDFLFQDEPHAARALLTGATYLEDGEVTVEGLRIWGSPWQPWFYDWAFNLGRGRDIDAKWRLIPEGIDVLVTHGPPYGLGDTVWGGEHVGCQDLLRHLRRVKPRLHLFGHIHEARGEWQEGPTRVVNVTTSECEAPATVITLPHP
jgi:predicted phosphodiesterase